MDRVVDDYAPVVAGLENDIDEIEDEVFGGGTERLAAHLRALARGHRLPARLDAARRRCSRRLMADPAVGDEERRYLRDVQDHALRVQEQVDGFRQLLQNILNVNLTLETKLLTEASNAQNEEVKRISAWAAILFAPTLIGTDLRHELRPHARAPLAPRLPDGAAADGGHVGRPLPALQEARLDLSRADTATRSLEHWSEAGRRSMEGFYALASEDYRRLEGARDWAADLRERADADGRVRLLDVACGSGRFPAALLAAGLAARTPGLRVEVDLLDPSPFSLAEARGVLAPPFVAAADLEVGIERFVADGPPYDVAWATHALYAVPPSLLGEGLRRMNGALRAGGLGAVGQATSRSHYLRVYEAYRSSHAPEATPYTSAEGVADALREPRGRRGRAHHHLRDRDRRSGHRRALPAALPLRRHPLARADVRARAPRRRAGRVPGRMPAGRGLVVRPRGPPHDLDAAGALIRGRWPSRPGRR